MPNAKILRWEIQRDLYSTCSRWGLALGVTQILVFALGVTQILAFLDTNMLVSPTRILRRSGIQVLVFLMISLSHSLRLYILNLEAPTKRGDRKKQQIGN